MGPAIRKSIMHALRTFSQQINEAVEHSVSPKGLRWRWQASRAGIPFGEYVLQKTMRYRVEQAYLISRENGLLVSHVHHEASKIKDSDAVSAMFTAIQDFVKESFSPDRTGRLESADMGEFTLWAVHGPHALLVCVIRGVPPKSLRADLSAVLERIHFRYGDAIREYKGDTSSVPDVEVELERCLRFEAREESKATRKGPPTSIIVLLLLLLAAAAFLGVRNWRYSQQLERFDAALDAAPGVYVTDLERNGGDFTVRGLRDPLATSVIEVAESAGIAADRVSATMQPFQSLQPAILAERATRMFGQPGSVEFDVSETTLHVRGDAPWQWQQQLKTRFSNLTGVDLLDVSGLTASDRQAFENEVANLDNKTFLFERGIVFAQESEMAFREHAVRLRELIRDAPTFGYTLSLIVTGSTDSTGDAAGNAALADRRAAAAAGVLARSGIDAGVEQRPAEPVAGDQAQEDASKRYAQVDLQLQFLPEAP
jgi:OOP family OmpA-OmpF porin